MVTPAPMAFSSTKFTSDHEPDAMPDIIAACSRGNVYEPTFSATIWNPPPMNVDSEISAIAIGTDVVIVVSPSVSDSDRQQQEHADRPRVVGRVAIGGPAPEEVADAPGERRNPDDAVHVGLRQLQPLVQIDREDREHRSR